MFECFCWVIKGGVMVVEDGDISNQVFGEMMFVELGYDEVVFFGIKDWFEDYYMICFCNYVVDFYYVN